MNIFSSFFTFYIYIFSFYLECVCFIITLILQRILENLFFPPVLVIFSVEFFYYLFYWNYITWKFNYSVLHSFFVFLSYFFNINWIVLFNIWQNVGKDPVKWWLLLPGGLRVFSAPKPVLYDKLNLTRGACGSFSFKFGTHWSFSTTSTTIANFVSVELWFRTNCKWMYFFCVEWLLYHLYRGNA